MVERVLIGYKWKNFKNKMSPVTTEIKKKYEICEICGCKSKVVKHTAFIGGGGDFLVCPGDEKFPDEHDILTEKLELLEEEHPKSYKEELKKEIIELRKKFEGISPKEK